MPNKGVGVIPLFDRFVLQICSSAEWLVPTNTSGMWPPLFKPSCLGGVHVVVNGQTETTGEKPLPGQIFTTIAMTATMEMTAYLCALGAAAAVCVAIYRVYLSPLARFPGPKLAALTGLYEGFFDCFKEGGGRFYVEINRMHDEYGKMVLFFSVLLMS